mmetsp:Transcript_18324/g.39640  ORF Transcript_18324/g.39640 Transcript_18324/m.39640 type:complete len:654 (+) Transcript_18324:146-2107(+)
MLGDRAGHHGDAADLECQAATAAGAVPGTPSRATSLQCDTGENSTVGGGGYRPPPSTSTSTSSGGSGSNRSSPDRGCASPYDAYPYPYGSGSRGSNSSNNGNTNNNHNMSIPIAMSPGSIASDGGQSQFSYNQMEDGSNPGSGDSGESGENVGGNNMYQYNSNSSTGHGSNNIRLSRVGSTDTNQTALTTITDWTQMEQIYRASSVCTEAIESNGLANPLSFCIVCGVVFVGEMARGILLPTLWGFVQDLGGDTVTMGWSVAAFSFGRVVTSPLFGWLSVHSGYQLTLAVALALLSLGAFLYGMNGVVGSPYFLIMAQSVMGIGSGTLGVTRAYVAEVSPKKLRTRYLAYLAMTRDAGFTITPFFGSALSYYFTNDEGGDVNVVNGKFFKLDQYTSPAFLLFLFCVAELFMVVFFLEHRRREVMPRLTRKISSRLKVTKQPPAAVVMGQAKTVLDMSVIDVTIWGVVALNVISKGALSTYETLGVKLAEEVFGIPSTTVGVTIGICGVIGVLLLLNFKYISKCFTDVQLVIGGQLFFAIGIAIMTDYGKGNMSLAKFISGFFFIFALGFPINDTSIVGLFSKVCGNKPQGTLQGLLAMSSAIARLVVPILSAYICQYLNMTVLFIGVNIILVASAVIVFRYRHIIELLSSSLR